MVGLAQDLPNVILTEVSDDASLVVAALDDLETAAGAGIVLAIAVLALFLRSIGATLVVSAAVPVSILAALFLLAGLSSGQYSLGSTQYRDPLSSQYSRNFINSHVLS